MPGTPTRARTSARRRPVTIHTRKRGLRASRESVRRVASSSQTSSGRGWSGASVPSKSRNSAMAGLDAKQLGDPVPGMKQMVHSMCPLRFHEAPRLIAVRTKYGYAGACTGRASHNSRIKLPAQRYTLCSRTDGSHPLHAHAALLRPHLQSLANRIRHLLGVVRVDHQRVAQFMRRSGETAQDQHAVQIVARRPQIPSRPGSCRHAAR